MKIETHRGCWTHQLRPACLLSGVGTTAPGPDLHQARQEPERLGPSEVVLAKRRALGHGAGQQVETARCGRGAPGDAHDLGGGMRLPSMSGMISKDCPDVWGDVSSV